MMTLPTLAVLQAAHGIESPLVHGQVHDHVIRWNSQAIVCVDSQMNVQYTRCLCGRLWKRAFPWGHQPQFVPWENVR